jgi:hypothetical protein
LFKATFIPSAAISRHHQAKGSPTSATVTVSPSHAPEQLKPCPTPCPAEANP